MLCAGNQLQQHHRQCSRSVRCRLLAAQFPSASPLALPAPGQRRRLAKHQGL